MTSRTYLICPSVNKSGLGVEDKNLCKKADVPISKSQVKSSLIVKFTKQALKSLTPKTLTVCPRDNKSGLEVEDRYLS